MRHIVSPFLLAVILTGCFLFSSISYATNSSISEQLSYLKAFEDKSLSNTRLFSLLDEVENNIPAKIEIWTVIATNHHSLGDLDSAIEAVTEAQKLATLNGLDALEADANKKIGIFNYYKGDIDVALAAYDASYQYYKSVDEPIQQANLLNNIGLAHSKSQNIASALIAYQLADPLYQEFGDEIDKVDIKFNIAGLHVELSQYDVAIRMLKEVLVTRQKLEEWHGVALTKNDLGIVYNESGQFSLAEKFYLEALLEFSDLGDEYQVASIVNNLAGLYTKNGYPLKGKKYALIGMEKSLKQGDQKSHAASTYNFAVALYQLGDNQSALTQLHLAKALCEKGRYKQMLNEIEGLYSLIWASQKENIKAYAKQLEYRKSMSRNSNQLLNEQLAIFNAHKLTQKVDKLEEESQLEKLKNEQNKQIMHFRIIAMVLILTILFFVYRRNAEQKTKRSLSFQVAKRTSQLQSLTEELKEADKIKSQFLANMSHEIRTPLTAIIGQSEAIGFDEIPDDLIKSEVEVIHHNSLHLLQLVNDILDLSKIEAEKFEIEISSYDVFETVFELQNIIDEQATKKGLTFTIEYLLPMPLFINTDGFRLNQILINLCSNAVKFTVKGDVHLKVELIDGNLVFQVSDTGIGMKEAHLQKVFKTFSQADNSISRQYGGTGLGLFLSSRLAGMLGGDIRVDSIVNEGSIFTLSIPYSEASLLEQKETLAATELWSLIPNLQLTGQILIADDHRDNRHLIGRLLSVVGLDVLYAENGIEAVDLYLKHQPEMILLDIQMPEMDGIQAFNKLRALGCHLPIYALTANAMAHEIKEYLEIGFTGHLKKPIERKEFFKALNNHFEHQATADEDDQEDSFESQSTPQTVDMSDLVVEFKKDLITEKQKIITSFEGNDLVELKSVVHQIAGAAAMFGLAKLSELALHVERNIKNEEDCSLSTEFLLAEFDKINID